MKFKIDENLPIEVAERLRQEGHDALTVIEQYLNGASDSDLASICQEEKRIIITLDTDFANIRIYPPSQFLGLIVLRLQWQDKFHVLKILERLIPKLDNEMLKHHLWIVEETRIRIRG
ncbi:MAG: hypothetical protein B5M51_06280 [Anaerolinea sp. 4484_236]|nr:MAG: hypothetical protein B5M51_06280 [Anaerolinea sp. 4484_236]OQY37572.1 MAG: hypothetical protein B6243_00155 [Anaerolineaceae bacterium 4572_5.2]RLD08546.1 MAG: hypothetical protein DRI56_05360 [Chloroflexota bacterium]